MLLVILFSVACLLEVTILGYRLSARSNDMGLAGIIRASEFILLAFALGLGIVPWDFRIWLFCGFLFMQLLFTALYFFRKTSRRKPFRSSRAIMGSFGVLMLILLAALPAILLPESGIIPPTGRYQVLTNSYTYTDENRPETFSAKDQYRKVNVGFWYPEAKEERFPLVVFSHGGMSVKTSNESLYYELASHGYVVCSIDHPYHSLYTDFNSGRRIHIDGEYMRQLQKEDAKENRQQSLSFYQQWMKIRMDDMDFVLDSILDKARNGSNGMPYSLVDGARIGVMGHSLGGAAALGIGRYREGVGAVVALESPFLCDITDVENGEFVFTDDAYPVPVLNIYSDSSFPHLSDWPQYAENQKLMEKPQESSFYIHIQGAGHFSLTDLSLVSPLMTWFLNGFVVTADTEYCLKTLSSQCLQFFDCYLKKEGIYKGNMQY